MNTEKIGFDPDEAPDLIMESLRASLGGVKKEKINEIMQEMENAQASSKEQQYYKKYIEGHKSTTPQPLKQEADSPTNINVESAIAGLYEMHDALIEMFKHVGLNNEISDSLIQQINNCVFCIQNLGGVVDQFVPEDYVSGLIAPDLEENAKKVIATTQKCYKIGSIADESVQDDGRTIQITFQGEIKKADSTMLSYLAHGIIKANENGWTGNEAIDYIYKSDGGKMSVRAFNNNKWTNISDAYNIKWELEEFPQGAKPTEKPDSMILTYKEIEKQKEMPISSENNNPESFGDFEIISKE